MLKETSACDGKIKRKIYLCWAKTGCYFLRDLIDGALKGWQSSVALLYQVKSIPTTFLLDENNRILAKNLRGPALEEKIKELLNVK